MGSLIISGLVVADYCRDTRRITGGILSVIAVIVVYFCISTSRLFDDSSSSFVRSFFRRARVLLAFLRDGRSLVRSRAAECREETLPALLHVTTVYTRGVLAFVRQEYLGIKSDGGRRRRARTTATRQINSIDVRDFSARAPRRGRNDIRVEK